MPDQTKIIKPANLGSLLAEIPNILIVDDVPANLELLSGMLRERGYEPRPILSGKLALLAARAVPPDLILLDLNMPEMSGYEVCEHLKNDLKLRDIPVIFISAMTETLDKVKAFSAGGVDYITKPFQFDEVHARVETHLRLRKLQQQLEMHNLRLEYLVKEKVAEISDSQVATIIALAKLAESRDDDTGDHIERTQAFSRTLAQKLGENHTYANVIDPTYITNFYHASALHDIGKVGIHDNILLKPGRLTPEEFEIMKTHTLIGANTLQTASTKYPRNSLLTIGIAVALSHHEKWDGSGYPDGLEGNAIPLSARLMAVADVYDALRSKRPYKLPVPHEESVEIIVDGSGKSFDPDIIYAFKAVEFEFSEIFNRMAR